MGSALRLRRTSWFIELGRYGSGLTVTEASGEGPTADQVEPIKPE